MLLSEIEVLSKKWHQKDATSLVAKLGRSGKSNQWIQILRLIQLAREPDSIFLSAVISALARARRWEAALAVFGQSVQTSAKTWDATMSVCERSDQCPTTLQPNVFQEHRKKHCDFHHSHQGMQGVDNRSRLFASTKRICSTAWCLALHSCSQHDCFWIYWAVGGCSFNSGWYGKKYGPSWLVHVWCNDQVLWYRRFRIERHALKSWCCIVERWRLPVERFSFYHCWILIVFNLCNIILYNGLC